MQSPLFWIIIALIVLIVGREIMLWYWRINTIIKNQEEQLDIMDEILLELKANNERFINEPTEETDTIEEVTPNEEDTP